MRLTLSFSLTASFSEKVVIRPAEEPLLNGCKLQETRIGIKLADQGDKSFVASATPILFSSLLVILGLRKLL